MRTVLCLLVSLGAMSISRADPPGGPPPPKLQLGAIYYPEPALRQNIEGKVLVEFMIKSDGSLEKLGIVSSDNKELTKAVLQYMKHARFEMPDSDTLSLRSSPQRLGFVFCIPPSSLEDTFGLARPAVFVMHNRFPQWTLANPPTADSKGPCTKELPAPILLRH